MVDRKGKVLSGDAGWGCMVRAGQMILCQALKRHFIDRADFFDLQDTVSNP